jgi:KDO2-lipid IV(A) lauroyltransferase
VLGFTVHGMVEDIDPDTNAALAAYRTATGMQLLSRNTGLRQLYRLLKDGSIVLLVADRVIGEGSDGMLVPFGNAMRPVPTGPAAFAIATGVPIFVGHIVRGPGGSPRYLLHVDPPIEPAGHSRETLTRLVAARFDTLIRQHPDQWYVFQPDWHPRDPGA